jgi:hypothetical protein
MCHKYTSVNILQFVFQNFICTYGVVLSIEFILYYTSTIFITMLQKYTSVTSLTSEVHKCHKSNSII